MSSPHISAVVRTQAGGHGTSRVLATSGGPESNALGRAAVAGVSSLSSDLAVAATNEEARAQDPLRGPAMCIHGHMHT